MLFPRAGGEFMVLIKPGAAICHLAAKQQVQGSCVFSKESELASQNLKRKAQNYSKIRHISTFTNRFAQTFYCMLSWLEFFLYCYCLELTFAVIVNLYFTAMTSLLVNCFRSRSSCFRTRWHELKDRRIFLIWLEDIRWNHA
mgnify:FL=1